jgi:hypothetical protein
VLGRISPKPLSKKIPFVICELQTLEIPEARKGGRDAGGGDVIWLGTFTSSPHFYCIENTELGFLLHHPCYISTLKVTGERSCFNDGRAVVCDILGRL